jgi:CubicO group peptidase (beta-lactamase class C family)
MERLLAEHDVPGCSVAVLEGGSVHTDVAGIARDGVAMDPRTRLQACSMTKPVATLAALRLVDQGRLSLDAPVTKERLTLRQLASHTSGLEAHPGFPGYRRGERLPTLAQVLDGSPPANAPGLRIDRPPGAGFAYSGIGTTLLQQTVEEVTGIASADLLTSLVLEPLGMVDSSMVQELDDPLRAYGHGPGSEPVPGGWHVHPETCAAGLWTTPTDYVRLLAAVHQAYAGASGALLAAATARAALSPVVPVPTGPDMCGLTHVGLGFFLAVDDRDAPTWFGHTGSNRGFVCASVADVASGRAAVVMTNSDDGTPVVKALLREIAADRGWADLELP